MISNQQIQKNWPKIKLQVLNKWDKLSEADVEKTHGNINALGSLVQLKYGNANKEDFNKTYEKICEFCIPSSKSTLNTIAQKQADGIPDVETKFKATPSSTIDDTFHSGSPERRANSNFAKINNVNNLDREIEDELSAYSSDSRALLEVEEGQTSYSNDDRLEYGKKSDKYFATPDESSHSQDPSPSREDITLGRNTSSATNTSTAKAASRSSEEPSSNV